jgi:hypothetical protein
VEIGRIHLRRGCGTTAVPDGSVKIAGGMVGHVIYHPLDSYRCTHNIRCARQHHLLLHHTVRRSGLECPFTAHHGAPARRAQPPPVGYGTGTASGCKMLPPDSHAAPTEERVNTLVQ